MQVPDIIDNAYVIVEFDNGSRGMLDLCMFAEGSKNEQEISVVGDIGKVKLLQSLNVFLWYLPNDDTLEVDKLCFQWFKTILNMQDATCISCMSFFSA